MNGTGCRGSCPRLGSALSQMGNCTTCLATVGRAIGHDGVVSSEDLENYETEAELALYREYRDVVGLFRYVVETERRFYLCNKVDLQVRSAGTDIYFEVTMQMAVTQVGIDQQHPFAARSHDRRQVGRDEGLAQARGRSGDQHHIVLGM